MTKYYSKSYTKVKLAKFLNRKIKFWDLYSSYKSIMSEYLRGQMTEMSWTTMGDI